MGKIFDLRLALIQLRECVVTLLDCAPSTKTLGKFRKLLSFFDICDGFNLNDRCLLNQEEGFVEESTGWESLNRCPFFNNKYYSFAINACPQNGILIPEE